MLVFKQFNRLKLLKHYKLFYMGAGEYTFVSL
jgi:hypothetical protein